MTNPYASPAATEDTAQPLTDMPANVSFLAWNGRIGRVRYVVYSLGAMLLATVILAALAIALSFMLKTKGAMPELATWLPLLLTMVMVAIGLVFVRRRFQDLDTTPWATLLMLVPIVNALVGLRLLLGKGTPASNRFGPPPCANRKRDWVLFVLVLLAWAALIVLPFAFHDTGAI